MNVTKWEESKYGKLNFENIFRFYSSDKSITLSKEPPFIRSSYAINGEKKYAVRWNSYEPGADFSGELFVECIYFVLKGHCEITVNEKNVELHKSDYFDFPKGKYKFKSIGEESFEYIAVYKMPDNFQIPDLEYGDAFR